MSDFLPALLDLQKMLASAGAISAVDGFEDQIISFLIVLDPQGNVLHINDVRPNKTDPQKFVKQVPKFTRTSGVRPYYLWDKYDYVLGQHRDAFVAQVNAIHAAVAAAGQSYPILDAIVAFYANGGYQQPPITGIPAPDEFNGKKQNLMQAITFMLNNRTPFDDPQLCRWLTPAALGGQTAKHGTCAVTGKHGPLADTVGAIKKVPGTQPSGAALISFNNIAALNSFGLRNQENAPISVEVAQGFHRGVNYLLDAKMDVVRGNKTVKVPRHQVRTDKDVILFWTNDGEIDDDIEAIWEDSQSDAANVKTNSLSPVRAGGTIPVNSMFHALKLRGMMGRIAVTGWYQDFEANVKRRADEWRLDCQIDDTLIKRLHDYAVKKAVTINQMVNAVAGGMPDYGVKCSEQRNRDILFSGLVETAILDKAFPPGLFGHALYAFSRSASRVRAELHARTGDPRYALYLHRLAVVIKIILKRVHGVNMTSKLDTTNNSLPYRLGRWFALLEYAQERAIPNIYSGVSGQFSAAMSNPFAVFPQLAAKNKYHLALLNRTGNGGTRVHLEKMIADAMPEQSVLPKKMSQQQQGEFVIGYWHQRNAIFTPKASGVISGSGNNGVEEIGAND